MAQNKLTDSEVTIAAVLIITITAVILIGIFMLISLAVMSSWNLLSESAGWQMLIPVNFGTVTGSALILMFVRWMTKRKGK